MFKKTKVFAGVIVALGGSMALSAYAQTDRVEITGSRILSLGATSPSPLQVLTAEDIAKSGVTNIQELLQKNPTLGTPTLSRTNSNFLTSGGGVATVNLRNLGDDRTLVLVNGRRYVSGVPGSAAVDLNTIPTDFIERVEILTGGASATYGSDAVAGVVNIILKRSFQGIVLDASKGRSEKNDDTKDKFSLTFGSNSADNKATMMGHFGYSKQGLVRGRDRDGGALDSASTGAFVTGDAADIFKVTSPFFSSFAPQGRFFVGAVNRTFDRAGNIILFSTNGPAGDGVGATGFNRQEFRSLAVPTERFVFASKGEIAITDNFSAFIEGNYAQSKTKTQIEPFPLDSASNSGGLYPATGRGPAEFRVGNQILANPLIPAGLLALMTDTNGDGLRDYSFTRRLSEVGTRGATADRDTFRIVSGVKGTVFGSWDYDAFLAYGSNTESQVGGGQVNVLNFRNAMEAVPDINDVNGNGNRTEAICLDAQARRQGCVPANVFGFNTLSAAAIKYITAPTLLTTSTTQKIAGANVRGEPFVLPAGPAGVAVGFEFREEFSRSEFDPLAQAGLNAGNAIPRTEGSFTVKEAYGEVRLPLLKGAALAESLTASGAVRAGDYSTVGSTLSWTTSLEWAPVKELRFRATHALATRAPNIGELFSPPSQTFPTGLNDPCSGVTATSTGPTAVVCRAAPGVAANIAANGGVFGRTQADQQGISGFNTGNPNLKEEDGKSTTLGLVYTPTGIAFLKNTLFTADFFRIKIDDPIVTPPRQFILDQCYTGNLQFCQFVTRRPNAVGANSAGSIQGIDAVQRNGVDFFSEGVDLTAAWADKLGPGRLSAKLSWTHISKAYTTPLPGADRDPFAGEVGSAKDKASLRLSYNLGQWGLTTETTFIGKSSLDNTFLAGFDDADGNSLKPGALGVGARTYTDLNLSYTFGKTRLYFGVDNAFGTKPPVIPSGVPGNVTGTTTAADVYDAIGRRYYVGVRFEM
jgi:iron complex outermembrane recepter protein